MLRVLAAALLLLLVLPAGDLRAQDAKTERRDKAFRTKVDKATQRGARWLDRNRGGSWGEKALAALTLAHLDRGLDDASFRSHFETVIERAEQVVRGRTTEGHATYALGIVAMLIHEVYRGPHARPPDRDRVPPTPANPAGLPPRLRVLVMGLGKWFERTRIPGGLWGYGNVKVVRSVSGYGGDLSNAQYAMLGLWAVAKLGEEIDPALLRGVGEVLLRFQEASGPEVRRFEDPDPGARGRRRYAGPMDRARGFGYAVSTSPTVRTVGSASGSMTAGGLSSLFIVKALLLRHGALREDSALLTRLDQGVWDAIAWLQRHYSVTQNPVPTARGVRSGGWHAYYLYGLERAMEIGGKRYLGDHDWYREGATLLLEAQTRSGSWGLGLTRQAARGAGALRETCFALLFLKRASLRSKRPLLRTEVTPSEKDVPPPSGR